jgi:hypothetical protein
LTRDEKGNIFEVSEKKGDKTMRALLRSVCEDLNRLSPDGWEIDEKNTKSAYLFYIKNAEGAIVEACDRGRHIIFESTISHILRDNKSINISSTKPSAQIARELKRRLLDGYTEAFIAAKKKNEEEQKRAEYLRTIAADIASRYGLEAVGREFIARGGKDREITIKGYAGTPDTGCALELRKLTQAQVLKILDIVTQTD